MKVGPPGPFGPPGKDAVVNEALLDKAARRIIEGIVSTLPVKQGEKGDTVIGPMGLTGAPGRDGRDGVSIKGDEGERGAPGRDVDEERLKKLILELLRLAQPNIALMRGPDLMTPHVAAADPHPTYLTQAEGGALYEVINAVATHEGAADPHSLYLLADGTRALTANWDVGAFKISVGQFQATPSATKASAADAIWDGVAIKAATATITGSTNITTAGGFNLSNIAIPTLEASELLTVTTAASLYLAGPPTAAATLDSGANINEGGTFSDSDTTLTVTDITMFGTADSTPPFAFTPYTQNIEIDDERLGITAAAAAVDSTANVNDEGGAFIPPDTTLTTTDGNQFDAPEIIKVNNELMRVTAVDGNNLTVVRGVGGSTAGAHTNGDDIYHFNDLTVTRGEEGTTAASHADDTDICFVTPLITTPITLRVDAGDVSLDGNLGLGTEATAPSERLQAQGNIWLNRDNDKLLFGANKDGSLYFDGSDVILTGPGGTSELLFSTFTDVNLQGIPLIGNTTSEGSLTLSSTSHANLGRIYFGATLNSAFWEEQSGVVRERLGIGQPSPAGKIHVDQSNASGAIPALILDQGDVSEQCIDFTSDDTDRDINLFTVHVTGTPTLLWDESEDGLNWSKGMTIAGAVTISSTLDVVSTIQLGAQNVTLDTPAAGVLSLPKLRLTSNIIEDSSGDARITTSEGEFPGVLVSTNRRMDVEGYDNTGHGVRIRVANTWVNDLSFAVFSMEVAGGSDGGLFFGSRAGVDAYGIVNGVTFGAGTATQDIGFRDGAAIGGSASGPAVIIKGTTGDMGIGTGTTAPAAQLHVDQSSASGAQPVLLLDQADLSEQCIKFSSDAVDRDINLFTVGVTGTPALAWDESEDGFNLSKGLMVAGSFGASLTAISSNTTLDTTHHVVTCDASGGAFTVTLPASSGITGRVYHIKKTDSSGNAVTVDGNAAETIDGAATAALSAQYESIQISCDGSNWHII